MEKAFITRNTTLARNALLAFGCSIILAVSAQLSIPLLPIPVTFQTMALLGMAVLLGPELACSAVILYLFEGASGLPVFAGLQSGLPIGPAGGYLLAFIPAALIAGYIGQSRSFTQVVLAGLASTIIVLTIGMLYLSHFTGMHTAFAIGVKPFILIEALKVLAVATGISLSVCRSKKASA